MQARNYRTGKTLLSVHLVPHKPALLIDEKETPVGLCLLLPGEQTPHTKKTLFPNRAAPL